MVLPRKVARAVAGALLVIAPDFAAAHSFGRVYNLPVPFWLYAWGATSALIVSFLIVGYFGTVRARGDVVAFNLDLSRSAWLQLARRLHLPGVLKLLSVGGLLLCMVTGFFGSKSPYGNFNMTFFWIVFVLGFTYLTAVVGNIYSIINPWRVIAEAIGRVFHDYGRGYVAGRFHYPSGLGYWPALAFYMAFIWIELFGGTDPYLLAVVLGVYTLINLLGIGLVGIRDWFRYCEFFSVFLRLVAQMAPFDYQPAATAGGGHFRLRAPFAGLVESRAENPGMLVFVLFMLSSTAFDGLRETALWQQLFWLDLYDAVLRDWVGQNPLAAFPRMTRLFMYWQSFWLLMTPAIYLAIYTFFVGISKWVTRSSESLRELSLQFALPLLPIALVYNITHYYTLIQSQGVKIVSLASDPFGWGWNLFGTANWLQYTIIPDAGTVWHVQVCLIVFGHIVSVVLSHRVALRLFPTRRLAVISQLPMLVLMVIFTTVGLWILSQPLK